MWIFFMCPISPLQETPVQQVDLKGKGKVFPREVGHTLQTFTSVLIQLALHHRSFIFQFPCFVPATNFDKPSQMASHSHNVPPAPLSTLIDVIIPQAASDTAICHSADLGSVL